MIYVIIAVISFIAVFAIIECITYFYTVCGLIYYLLDKYDDDIDTEQLKELAVTAARELRRRR